jgi:hypothetical protein
LPFRVHAAVEHKVVVAIEQLGSTARWRSNPMLRLESFPCRLARDIQPDATIIIDKLSILVNSTIYGDACVEAACSVLRSGCWHRLTFDIGQGGKY